MHTIIHPLTSTTSPLPKPPIKSNFRSPHYDCVEQADNMKVIVYVPGVEASGDRNHDPAGPTFPSRARKSHFVRVNWKALHLESAQRDYQLRLRLGTSFDYERPPMRRSSTAYSPCPFRSGNRTRFQSALGAWPKAAHTSAPDGIVAVSGLTTVCEDCRGWFLTFFIQ